MAATVSTNHSLRTVIAVTTEIVHADHGFTSIDKNKITNTQTKVLAAIAANFSPTVRPEFWQFADEVIGFFQNLDSLPEAATIYAQKDGPMYKQCVEVARADEVTALNFGYAVAMPNLYSKLKPTTPKKLNPLKSEAKLIQAGEWMGKLNEEDRFFVKLVRVGDHDATRGGNSFVVTDRAGNVGFFYEKPDKLVGSIQLGDCFAMHATPMRHSVADNGEKHTIFRTVKILKDTIIPGKMQIDPANDKTGKFIKNNTTAF